MSGEASRPFSSDDAIAHIGGGPVACTLSSAEWTRAALWIIQRRGDLYPPEDMPRYHETITRTPLRAARAYAIVAPADEPVWLTCNRLLACPTRTTRPDQASTNADRCDLGGATG